MVCVRRRTIVEPQSADALTVQIGRGFIQYKHLRPHGPCAGTGDALFLPAGQGKDIPIQERTHAADLGGGIQCPGHLLLRGSPALHAKEHLAGSVQIEELRHVAAKTRQTTTS